MILFFWCSINFIIQFFLFITRKSQCVRITKTRGLFLENDMQAPLFPPPPPPPLAFSKVKKNLSSWSQKIRNVPKRMQKHFFKFFHFLRLRDFHYLVTWEMKNCVSTLTTTMKRKQRRVGYPSRNHSLPTDWNTLH